MATSRSSSATPYASNFYAFEQTPPYRVVIRSGALCLGFGRGRVNKIITPSSFVPGLYLEKKKDCPHLISSMTEKAGDDSVIVGYINDCVPRFVEIGKSRLGGYCFNGEFKLIVYCSLRVVQSVTVERNKRGIF
jgi:hypothetical protein